MFKKYPVIYILLLLIPLNKVYADSIPIIKNGTLDLRNHKLNKLKSVTLKGEWEFYWNQLLEPEDFNDSIKIDKTSFINVPSVWTNLNIEGRKLPPKGCATYRITVYSDNYKEKLAIKLGSIGTAFKAYVDGKLLAMGGFVSESRSKAKPGYNAGVFSFKPKSNKFDVIIQVSNYHYSKGGIWNVSNSIGLEKNIEQIKDSQIELKLLLIGCILIIAIYHLGLFTLNRHFRSTIYFSIFCLVIVVRALMVSELYILKLFPDFNWFLIIKAEYLSLILGPIFFSLFVYKVFIEYYSKTILKIIVILDIILGAIILVTKSAFYTKFLLVYQLVIIFAASYVIYVVILGLIKKDRKALIFFIGFAFMMGTVVNDILYTAIIVNTAFLTSYGLLFFIISQAYMLSSVFSKLFIKTEKMADEMESINQILEKNVVKRTAKIQEQNDLLKIHQNEILNKNTELEHQNEEIRSQRDRIEEQHQIVIDQKRNITDSIQYAKRIQQAILPSESIFHDFFRDYFIFYKSKDIVSGDFYWAEKIKNYLIIATADCTGHSVPGAFMSMLGIALLNEVVHKENVVSASMVLDELREKVKTSLHQTGKSDEAKDGMNIAVCILNLDTYELQFSGAYHPLFIMREGNLITIKPDRQPISIFRNEKKFTNNDITLNKEDILYTFSDGFADQTGGRKNRKFMNKNFRDLLLDIHLKPMAEQKEILQSTLNKWKNENTQTDDILVIGLKI